jgi:aspartate kinase
MLGVTNRLLDVARLSASGDVPGASQRVRSLLDSHIQVARALCSPLAASKCVEALNLDTSVAEDSCAVLAKSAAIGAKARTEGQFAADAIATLGEQWASRIMASHLRDDGLDAVFVNSKDVIVTDGIPNNSQPLLKESHTQSKRFLSPLLHRGAVPIITGFYGASRNGQITTLGRGGSDLSAAVIAHCIDATAIRLYKVEHEGSECAWVAGWVGVVHDADPSTTIPHLHYEEARELAHFSKKVLHPETVSPAVDACIPIEVRNTLDASHPGTLITADGVDASGRIQSITHQPLKAYSQVHSANGFGVDSYDVEALKGISHDEIAIIALVGYNIMLIQSLATRALTLLNEAGIPATIPRRVNGSLHNLSVLVPNVRRKDALMILHENIVRKFGKSIN